MDTTVPRKMRAFTVPRKINEKAFLRKQKDILNLLDDARHLLWDLQAETNDWLDSLSNKIRQGEKGKQLEIMAWHIRNAEGFCMSAQDELTEIEFPKEDS